VVCRASLEDTENDIDVLEAKLEKVRLGLITPIIRQGWAMVDRWNQTNLGTRWY